jgi:hypothetical protein
MNVGRLILVAVLAVPVSAQVLTSTPHGVVAAHDGRIELGTSWSVEGVAHATAIAAGDDRVAVLDALSNEAVVVELATGRSTRIATAETPIAAVFAGHELYILARDARVLQHGEARIELAADPAFLRAAGGRLYVYSRANGIIEEVEGDRITRRLSVAPFASDFEVSGTSGYLVYPRGGRIHTIDLAAMKASGELAIGSVPVDLTFAGGGTALTARILAVADPSAKRVWLAEGTQSMTKAVARGALRGLLGLGLFGNGGAQFPTGVDRVEIRGKAWIAYDTSTATLYTFTRKTSSVLARGIAPGAFTLTGTGVAWWNGTSVAEKRLQ